MGRMYTPVELIFSDRSIVCVGIIDTGADETVISLRIAQKINAKIMMD